ncbi:MAG TPA: hypothetical protein VHQ02_11245 [Usitatibacter sp.]|jgi:hypothetical protein|nr:hypothetical protein [Usitatibacter sp.]
MSRRGAARLALVASTLLAGCALGPPGPGGFRFAVMGDTPYNTREERAFVAMIARLDREPIAFAIHVGDLKAGGNSPCTDELFLRRKAELDRSAHPIVLTPGDNDWTDCRRASNGATDPIERLARLREIFFADAFALGREKLATRAQSACIAPVIPECGCAAHPENRLWIRSGVVFATLNVPGSNDNVGYDAANDAEARCRGEANRQWLDEAARLAAAPGTRGLVVALQADPWAAKKPVYAPLLRHVAAIARRLGKPMLFVHGDTHIYRVDSPFRDAAGAPIDNLTRLETYGSPFVGWVEVTVDPADPALFRFEPRLEALVP